MSADKPQSESVWPNRCGNDSIGWSHEPNGRARRSVRMSRIAAVAPVVPEHRYDQATITAAFAEVVLPDPSDRRVLDRLHAATGVRTRHLALPLEDYPALEGFGAANDVFIRVGTELGEKAVSEALAAAGLGPRDVDMLM